MRKFFKILGIIVGIFIICIIVFLQVIKTPFGKNLFNKYPIEKKEKYFIYYKFGGNTEEMKEHCAYKHGIFDYCETEIPYSCGLEKICQEPLGRSQPKPCCKLK